ncbi:L,D-transpeptidase family protein [Streptomyces sp. NPDC054796]
MSSYKQSPRCRLGAALLAAATLVPLALGSTGTADAAGVPSAVGPPASASSSASDPAPVPEDKLVPGLPVPAERPIDRDTPDQALPPSRQRESGGKHPARTPGAEQGLQGKHIEYVPPGENVRRLPVDQRKDARVEPGPAASPDPTDPTEPKDPKDPSDPDEREKCSTSTGPYQKQVERYLGLKADGKQSPADCLAIQKYQRTHDISPANGFAGPVTYRLLMLDWARRNYGKLKGCPVRAGRVVCVDLTRQIMWVRKGSKMIYEPVLIRSGRKGYRTRTGWFRIYWRDRDHRSSIYGSPMPFSQFFSGGQALHGIYKSIFSPGGSYGCVNLQYGDAERAWKVLRKNDRVYVWGRKPGT